MSTRLDAALACVNATPEERTAVQRMAYDIIGNPSSCDVHKQRARDTLDGIIDALDVGDAVDAALAHSDT